MQLSEVCRMQASVQRAPVVGEPHLVAPLLSINHPLIVQIKQVGVAVSIISLPSPVSLAVVNQLTCVFCHKLILSNILL